jgi:spore coat polysaccharide biosynthesis protein SpsF
MRRKIGLITQARMGSTRLPGKVMKNLLGAPMLEHFIARIKQAKHVQEIVIATTTHKRDDVIVNLAERLGVKSFRGSEDDVLGRYYGAAKRFKIDIIIRATSDCPLVDPQIIDEMVSMFLEEEIDYLSNNLERTYPLGLDVEIFSFSALERAHKCADADFEREHVTPYIRNNPEIFKIKNKCLEKDFSNYRLTVDTKEDFELIARIYKEFSDKKEMFLLKDVLNLLERKPELVKINQKSKIEGCNISEGN